jgi:hypothetical protein
MDDVIPPVRQSEDIVGHPFRQERERERAGIEAELRAATSARTATQLDTSRMRRVLEDGLSRLSDVLYADTSATRRALHEILAEKVSFMPIELATGERTYRFNASLSLGRIVGSARQIW